MDTREIVAAYCAAWNEPGQAKRNALLEAWFAEGGVYRDSLGSAHGRAALVAHIDGFHARRPGHTIELASGVDVTDAGLRWAWVMCHGDETVLEGMDFAELAADGRMQRIVGFFGSLPPLDD